MTGWKIASFDRVLGAGTITSGVGTLAFDASVALVDAFEVGEVVDVSLRASSVGQAYDVLRVAPSGFRRPFEAPSHQAIAEAIAGWSHEVVGRRAWLGGVEEDALSVRVEDDTYRPERAMVFGGCVTVQGPPEIDEIGAIHVFRMADVARLQPELVRAWPAPHRPEANARCVVFRVDPVRFGAGCLYVVAEGVTLMRGERPRWT